MAMTPEVLAMGAVAGFTIFLGLPVARVESMGRRTRAVLNAVAVGILLFLLVEVVKHGWEPVEDSFKGAAKAGASPVEGVGLMALFVGGLLLGLLSLVWFESRFVRNGSETVDSAGTSRGAPRASAMVVATMIAVGIGLHNFSEGLAIGSSVAANETRFALVLAVGFALHNATEGFGIAAPLAGTRPSWSFLAKVGLIGGGPTFVGTLLGAIAPGGPLHILFLSLAAGALIYVVNELLHHVRRATQSARDSYAVMAGVAMGLLLGLGTDLLVELSGG